MDNYTKEVEIKIKANKESVEKTKNTFKMMFKEGFEKGIGDFFSVNKDVSFGEQLGKALGKGIFNGFKDGIEALGDLLDKSLAELKRMSTFSSLSQSDYRDLAFQYGFTGSEAYGYTTAQKITGIGSMEDYLYAKPWEQKKFQEVMMKYAEKYSQLEESGFFDKYREFQMQIMDLKQNLLTDVVQFFVDNKDTIKKAMTDITNLSLFAIKALSSILSFLHIGESSTKETLASTSDIINNWGARNTSTQVKIDNTFNNVAREDQSWLENAGQQTYMQVVQYLNQGGY